MMESQNLATLHSKIARQTKLRERAYGLFVVVIKKDTQPRTNVSCVCNSHSHLVFEEHLLIAQTAKGIIPRNGLFHSHRSYQFC